MKRKIVCALIAAMSLSVCSPVYATEVQRPSIGENIPENVQVVESEKDNIQQVIVEPSKPENYTNPTAQKIVEELKDENTKTTVMDILVIEAGGDKNNVTPEVAQKVAQKVEEVQQKTGTNISLYEPLSDPVDMKLLKDNGEVTLKPNGEVTLKKTYETAKGMDKKDLMVMQMDPETGAVTFSKVKTLDPETGEVTATLESMAAVTLMTKVPIVVKDVTPEKYENETTKNTVESLQKIQEEKKVIELKDVLVNMGAVETKDGELVQKEVQISEDTTINIEEYNAAMELADLAIKQGEEDYSYNMAGTLDAGAQRTLDMVDWKRMVNAGYPDIDLDDLEANPDKLLSLEPFTLEGAFIAQMNPITGEMEYITDFELCFEMPEGEEEAVPEEKADEADAEEEEDNAWKIDDEDDRDRKMPNLVIRANYKSMGPFIIMMPKSTELN